MHSTQDVLEDPHIEAMGYLRPMEFPGASRDVPIIETPFRLSKTPGTIRRRAPLLGEHTDEVLGEIGYGPAEITELRDREIV
jgi:crotonobetainyl-CoA:carnitine CoA-transferase CaiB-like acyl-CoA transferase